MYFKKRLKLYNLKIYTYKHILFFTWFTDDNPDMKTIESSE